MAEAHTFAPLTDPNPQGMVARCIFEARDVFMWMRAGATHARLAISVEATKAVALALALDSRSICLWRKKGQAKEQWGWWNRARQRETSISSVAQRHPAYLEARGFDRHIRHRVRNLAQWHCTLTRYGSLIGIAM